MRRSDAVKSLFLTKGTCFAVWYENLVIYKPYFLKPEMLHPDTLTKTERWVTLARLMCVVHRNEAGLSNGAKWQKYDGLNALKIMDTLWVSVAYQFSLFLVILFWPRKGQQVSSKEAKPLSFLADTFSTQLTSSRHSTLPMLGWRLGLGFKSSQ